MMKKYDLLIPSSKLINIEMQNEFGAIPPILVPLNGKLIIDQILDQFKDANSIAISVEESAELTENYFQFFPNKKVKLIETVNTQSLSDTILQSLEGDALDNPLVMNFGDTLIPDFDLNIIGKDFIVFGDSQESERWTLFKEKNRKIVELEDKKFKIDTAGWSSISGLFGISKPLEFITELGNNHQSDPSGSFYKTIMHYYNSQNTTFYQTTEWSDFGHVDNYYRLRDSYIQSRYFNTNSLNSKRNTLKKTSLNRKKLVNEIKWYISLPEELRYYCPQLYDYNLSYHAPFIKMEFYSYPSLNETIVFSRYSHDLWFKIIKKIDSILDDFASYKISDDSFTHDLKKIYYEKTITRLDDYLQNSTHVISNEYNLNGVQCVSIEYISENLEEILFKKGLLTATHFNIIHGDLCLSNILYDKKFGILKLLDPRGEFGKYSIYGDQMYDLCKLSHSFLGHYDFILQNQYKLKTLSRNEYSLSFRETDYHQKIGEIFTYFMKRRGVDMKTLRFLESLLFLSMVPLHADDPLRQNALLLNGLKIFTESMGN